MHRLAFSDGQTEITYTPPKNWDYSGSGNHFSLRPHSVSGADAEITVNKLSGGGDFDEEATKRLCEEVLKSVPSGATNTTLVSQQLNPVFINRKGTFLVVISYDYYSQAYERSVMFLNRSNEQLRFQLTSYRNAFQELQKAFASSHYSWQKL
ncbi:MAG TPA: hypothetical protein VLK27_00125 [Chthoniobacterales bacterium]|nr:hypothetical protein [Chthoniobacterales bacterium]